MAERHTEHASKRRAKGGKAPGDDKKNRVPGDDSIAVLGALVLGKMFGGGAPPTTLSGLNWGPAPVLPTNAPADSILGGLTDLIGKLSAGGVAPQVSSWVGRGPNEPVQPVQLGSALGQNVLHELSQRTGMSQQELLNQLATVLPQIINHLTPDGRMPTRADLEKDDSADLPDADFLDGMRSVMSKIATSTSGVIEADLKWRAGYLEDVSTLLGGRRVLGSMIESDLEAHELLHRGLPRGALTSLLRKLHGFPVIEVSEALGISPRTLQRHKSTPAVYLDVQQSGRTWKFAEILTKATRVLGSQAEAEQWLRRPAIGLDQRRPVDLLTTPAGVTLVEDYLERLEYDVYT
jgi:putative toxin-antitoxin system antitoxin component (TIGR02293 family)